MGGLTTGSIGDLLAMLAPGMRVFVQGATGEPAAFARALAEAPKRAGGCEIWSCLLPGINRFDYGALPGGPRLVTFMASPALSGGLAGGQTKLLSIDYSRIAAALDAQSFDLAILSGATPDDRGDVSLGVCADTAPLIWPRAKRVAALVSSAMPRPPRSAAIPSDRIDLAIEVDDAPPSPVAAGQPSDALQRMAQFAAAHVEDGSVIQCGIGQAPDAVAAALAGHRGLRMRSGLIGEGFRTLAQAGALAGLDNVAGVAWGSPDLYAWLAQSDACAFRSIRETHDVAALGELDKFTCIGSALEIDLEGNANVEWRNGARFSAIGGALDFARAAALSRGGRTILALPAITSDGRSRIVGALPERCVSIPGALVDVVVTEHGAALLSGRSLVQRRAAVIAIAAPEHRAALEAAAR